MVVTELIWEEGLQRLREEIDEVVYDQHLWKSPQLRDDLRDADAWIVRNQTRVTEELLRGSPNLRVIGRLGVGLDNIDLAAAKKFGKSVVFAKNANATAVAEYVFAAMFSAAKPMVAATEDVKSGGWDRVRFGGKELHGKVLGLVGMGEIGTRIAQRARAFGMNVVAFDPFLPPYEYALADLGVQLTTLADLCAKADYISLHVPLTERTKGLIGEEELRLMQSHAVLIHTSRGGVVHEEALFAALEARTLGGAVLDVFSEEPPRKIPSNLPNLLLTPHVAGLTEEAQIRTSVLVAEEVCNVLRGRRSNCTVL